LALDLPPVQGIAEKTKFFVGDEQFGVEPFITRFRVERWAEAYETQHTIGYVYTLPEFAVAVYFAVRDLIWSEHGLSFDDASWTRTKMASTELTAFSKSISANNENHVPFSEPPFILERREFAQRNERKLEIIGQYIDFLGELSERCQTFQSHDGVQVSVDKVRAWLLQFTVEEIPLAVRVLGALRFWGRSALSDALVFSVAGRFPKGFQALGLGAPTASAHHLTYFWDDVRDKLGCDLSVVTAPSQITGNLPIVIYDDNVGSGGQAGTVFSQWFGVRNPDSDLDEQHASLLSPDDIQRLRHVPIFLVFATGFRSGLDRIQVRLQELAGNPDVRGIVIDPADLSCFRPAARVFNEPADADRAAQAFRRAGELALHDRVAKSNWSRERTSDRILGYGNAGGLTVFHYNVPTTTVTALWSSSHSEEANWTALFPRRPRTT
jgi:hypothetical protein